MPKYRVQMTFAAPPVQWRLKIEHRLLGRGNSMTLFGGQGMVVATARMSAESPVEAAMDLVKRVESRWPKSRGSLTLRSWTAYRDRVLFRSGDRVGGSSRLWPDGGSDGDGPDEGGSAGVREPRRPLPGPGSLHAALDLPGA